jgi:hydroxylamine reductase
MLCMQCEETMRSGKLGNGCRFLKGMCGKSAETSDLQDLLIYVLQGLSEVAVYVKEELGIISDEANTFVPKALFFNINQCKF